MNLMPSWKTIIAIAVTVLIAALLIHIALPAYQDHTYRSDSWIAGRAVHLEMSRMPGPADLSMRSENVAVKDDYLSSLEWVASMVDGKSGDKQLPAALPLSQTLKFRLELSHLAQVFYGEQRFPLSTGLDREIEASSVRREPVQLDVVLLTDPDFLRIDENDSRHKKLDIDLSLLNLKESEIEGGIQQSLGAVEYSLTSGAREGSTYVAVVLIKDGRALDQVIASYCTGHCEAGAPSGRVPGADTLLALFNNAKPTDATLFLTELQPGELHGVFLVSEPIRGQRFWTWSIRESGGGLCQ